MNGNITFATIAILSSTLFGASLAIDLTVRTASASDAGAVSIAGGTVSLCTKIGTCVSSNSALTSVCTVYTSCGGGQGVHTGGGSTTIGLPGLSVCVEKSGINIIKTNVPAGGGAGGGGSVGGGAGGGGQGCTAPPAGDAP